MRRSLLGLIVVAWACSALAGSAVLASPCSSWQACSSYAATMCQEGGDLFYSGVLVNDFHSANGSSCMYTCGTKPPRVVRCVGPKQTAGDDGVELLDDGPAPCGCDPCASATPGDYAKCSDVYALEETEFRKRLDRCLKTIALCPYLRDRAAREGAR